MGEKIMFKGYNVFTVPCGNPESPVNVDMEHLDCVPRQIQEVESLDVYDKMILTVLYSEIVSKRRMIYIKDEKSGEYLKDKNGGRKFTGVYAQRTYRHLDYKTMSKMTGINSHNTLKKHVEKLIQIGLIGRTEEEHITSEKRVVPRYRYYITEKHYETLWNMAEMQDLKDGDWLIQSFPTFRDPELEKQVDYIKPDELIKEEERREIAKVVVKKAKEKKPSFEFDMAKALAEEEDVEAPFTEDELAAIEDQWLGEKRAMEEELRKEIENKKIYNLEKEESDFFLRNIGLLPYKYEFERVNRGLHVQEAIYYYNENKEKSYLTKGQENIVVEYITTFQEDKIFFKEFFSDLTVKELLQSDEVDKFNKEGILKMREMISKLENLKKAFLEKVQKG
jgi:hypothetical protein